MKKRVLSIFLCMTMLFGILALSVSALETPAGSVEGSGVGELTAESVTAVDHSRNLALGLTSSTAYSDVSSGNWKSDVNNLTADEIADIADMSKYGFTVIGIKAAERQVNAAVDGVWSQGAKGTKGAFSVLPDGNLYNVNGETNKADSIYQTLLTLNFGYICELDAIGFGMSTQNPVGYLSACDIYVSDDGENWTLVGYWDRPAKKAAGTEYTTNSASVQGADAYGSLTKQKYSQFALPEGTTGRYLRLAATAMEGTMNGTVGAYDGWAVATTASSAFREMYVFGEAADVNYVGSQERVYTDNEVSKYDVRFIASMDDYHLYDNAGFMVQATFEKGVYAETGRNYNDRSDYVYTSLTAADATDGTIVAVEASDYHAGQLFALTVKGIPVDSGRATFIVTPYYEIAATHEHIDVDSFKVVYENGEFVSAELYSLED